MSKIILAAFFIPLLFCSSSFANDEIELIIGSYDNPPKIEQSKNGKVIGFWPELLGNIAAKEGWKISYLHSTWQKALTNLENNKIDIMPDVAFTPERAKLYEFNKEPVMVSWSRVYVRADNNSIKSIEDLGGKRIAGLMGSVNLEGSDGIKRLVQSFNINATIVEMQSYNEVFEALLDGFADAVITNRNFGDKYILDTPIQKTAIVLQPVSLMFAFSKNSEKSEQLSRRIDFHLSKMKNNNDSIYYQLLTKYFETEIAEKHVKFIPRSVKIFMITLGITVLFFVALTILAKAKVKQKTKELQYLNDNLKDQVNIEISKRMHHEKLFYEQKKFADMGQMIGSISHQWRQPLNSIYIISQNIQDEWRDGETYVQDHEDQFKKQADIIHHMSETIDDFRNFFKPDKELKTFDVANTFTNCLRLINVELIDNNIITNVKCKCETQECEISDNIFVLNCCENQILTTGYEGELKQVFLNLLSNAKDSMVTSQKLRKELDIYIYTKVDKIFIEISDNGTGIPTDVIDNIFDPYFSTKGEGKGAGIGLYMSKTILQNHMNGDVYLENTADGAKAVVTLARTIQ